MEENIKNYCRICLDVESEHVSILEDPTILLHLKSCLSMTVSTNDGLPKVICGSCVSQLNDFYNFQHHAYCSQDWLESISQEKAKKSAETKTPIQPLPDSEYNSDSLLEFLNNTANIEEYLNNLGKEDIPSIVDLFDKNENAVPKPHKIPTPKKKDIVNKEKTDMNMEIDVLDSDVLIVKEILLKKLETKVKINKTATTYQKSNSKPNDKRSFKCFACNENFENISKLVHHLSTCDLALRTCIQCKMLFDSKLQLHKHFASHNSSTIFCMCGQEFLSMEVLEKHQKTCLIDHGEAMGCSYRCMECGENFKERVLLYQHAKGHILKSEERICDICGHSFIGSSALAKHKQDEHEKPVNALYRCKVCKFTSSDHKETYMHVKSHTQPSKLETTRHLCESCGRSFATPMSLHRHSLQHTKLKEYVCSICRKQFSEEKMRDKHLLEHSKVIMCERCGQTVDSFNINVHKCK